MYVEGNKDSLDPTLYHLLSACHVLIAGLQNVVQDVRDYVEDTIEEDKRVRSVVVDGLVEHTSQTPSLRHKADVGRIGEMLDIAGIEATPLAIYRMGQVRLSADGNPLPRPIKVLMPCRSFARTLVYAAKSIRESASLFVDSDTCKVFIRPSLTKEQRLLEYNLRKEKKRLALLGQSMAIFDGKLVPPEDIPSLKLDKKRKYEAEKAARLSSHRSPATGANAVPISMTSPSMHLN